MPSVLGIGSGSTMTFTKIKWLLKLSEWVRNIVTLGRGIWEEKNRACLYRNRSTGPFSARMKWLGARTWNAVVRNWGLRLRKKKGRVSKTSQCLSGDIGQAANLYWDMLSCRQSKKRRQLIWSVLIKTRVTDFLQALVPPVLVSHYSLSSKEKEIFLKT